MSNEGHDPIAPRARTPAPTSTICPRCAYDLHGVVESWTSACPLEGRCGECGLAFAWSDVVRPGGMPGWLVEHPRARWFAGTRTLLHSLVPWLFWRHVRMSMPFSWRLLGYPARLVVLLFVLTVIAATVRTIANLPDRLATDPEAAAVVIGGALLMPWSGEPVDAVVEKWRPGWTTLAPAAAPAPGRAVVPPPRNVLIQTGPGAWIPSRTEMPPPRQVWQATCMSAANTVGPAACALLVSFAAFAALPIVRARSKVRWTHLTRVALYGCGLLIVVAVMTWALDLIAGFDHPWPRRIKQTATRVQRPREVDFRFVPPLLLIWWWSAASLYLRLARPLAAALSVTVIGALAGLLLIALFDPHRAMRVVTLW